MGEHEQRGPQAPPPTATQELASFYERGYARGAEQAERFSRWRALGARGKADHVIELCRRARVQPASTLEVGCGDGALLSELRRRGFGGRLQGIEISSAAVAIARMRAEIDAVELYDGSRIPAGEGSYALGILSHVLEHVPDPSALLAEAARACGAVVLEVPLEANLSARRASRRAHSEEVGHLQRLDRTAARALIARAGLRRASELEDPLPLATQLFFAESVGARLKACARWGVRRLAHALAPALARRLFTVHYAALCLPRDA
jgi:SAM-dependent methyltransferase